MLFVGIDWSERWHDVCLMREGGRALAERHVEDSVAGLGELLSLIASHLDDPEEEVVVGVETPHGLMVGGLRAAGYTIYPINPKSVDRYRDRNSLSKAKTDRADARTLADVVRTDRHQHRPMGDDTEQAEAVKVLARSHKRLIWSSQRLRNQLRSQLREFYPGALEAFGGHLGDIDSLTLLEYAPTPQRGRALSTAKIASALRKAHRHHVEQRASEIREALRAPRLEQPAVVAQAHGAVVIGLARSLRAIVAEAQQMEKELAAAFRAHPDAEIYLSQPGLADVLGARALGEFGDDPNTYQDGRARQNYAGSSPLTKASGKSRIVHARFIRNRWLADSSRQWALAALSASPGARRFYDAQRARNKGHEEALRMLANKLIGKLHGCLRHRTLYDEATAWPPQEEAAAA